jgi:hypothetical protein
MAAVAFATTGEKQTPVPFVPLDIKSLKGIKLNGRHNLKLMKTSAYFNRFLSGYLGGSSFTRSCVVVTNLVSTDEGVLKEIGNGEKVLVPQHESYCGWFFDPKTKEFSELHWFPIIRIKSLSEYEKIMCKNYLKMSADLITAIPDEKAMALFVEFLHS